MPNQTSAYVDWHAVYVEEVNRYKAWQRQSDGKLVLPARIHKKPLAEENND